MSKIFLAALLGLGVVAAAGPVQAQSRADVNQIEQEYARTHNGQAIPDNELDYYLDELNNGSNMSQVRTEMSGTRGAWRPRRGWAATSVICSSVNQRYHECRVPFRGRARISSQISDTACVRGRTWGEKQGVVWVNHGCRARFSIERGNAGTPGYPGNGDNRPGNGGPWNNNYAVTCSSNDNRQVRCAWDERYGEPRLSRQLSQSACVRGRSWNYDNRNLWVSNGCRAEFVSSSRR
jgi:hypothetical protein